MRADRDRIYLMETLFRGTHFANLRQPFVVSLEVISRDTHAGGVVYVEVEVTGPGMAGFVRAFDATRW